MSATMDLTRRLRRAFWAPGILLVLARGALAANIIWSGGVNNAWDINTSDNWSGDATKFNDGDNVTFNDASTRTNINVSTTVSPAAKTFANTTAKNYTLTNGTLSGAGVLVVNGGGNLNIGVANSVAPNRTMLSFSGGSVISNGSRVAFAYSGSNQTNGIGVGAIVLDNGGIGIHMADNIWPSSSIETLTNAITVSAGGGTLYTRGRVQDSWQNTRAFSGLLTLGGNLVIDNQNYATGPVDATLKVRPYLVNFTGGVTVNAGVQIVNTNLGYNGSLNISQITFGGPFSGSGMLTLTGAVGTTYRMQATADATDLLSAMRGSGGSIKITPGLPLQLVRGYFRIADFTGSGNNVLEIRQRSQIGGANVTLDTANGSDNTLHIGPAAGHFSTLYFNIDQNQAQGTVLNGAGAGNVQIENGGILQFYAGPGVYWQVVPGGNYRFMNGAILQGDYNNTESISQVGTANHYLGDGNNATPDTVTFSTGSYFILHELANRTWSQDSGVTIRYTVTANSNGFGWANTTSAGNAQQATLPVKAGAAGTEFAPLAGGSMYLAGPASGNVMTITNLAKLITAGTVEFKNNTAVSTYVSGPIAITNGGTLAFATNGTVLASNVTFYTGSTQAVTVVGTASNAVGYLKVSGSLVFSNGVTLVGSNPSGFRALQGCWYVAEATTISGLPITRGFTVGVEPGIPQRLKMTPNLVGTVIMMY